MSAYEKAQQARRTRVREMKRSKLRAIQKRTRRLEELVESCARKHRFERDQAIRYLAGEVGVSVQTFKIWLSSYNPDRRGRDDDGPRAVPEIKLKYLSLLAA